MIRKLATAGLVLSLALAPAPAIPQPAPEPAPEPAPDSAEEFVSGLAPVPPELPIALLVDLSSGQTLYSREPQRRFVPASVTKVMTAYSAFALVEQGELPLDRPIPITEQLEEEWSGEGSSMFLKAGERPTIGELLLGITTVSANDGAVALAVAATGSLENWLELMNANAVQLGMRDTHFGTPNGWPDEGQTYTSARDLAILAEAMITRYPGLYRRYFGQRGMRWREITQANHDPITGRVEGADGIKTGYTRESGYNFLGSAERDGRRLVMVLAAVPTPRLRDQTARELLEWGFAAFKSRPLVPANTVVGRALVQNGATGSVRMATERSVGASLPRGGSADVSLSVRYRGPVEAPIAKGQNIGWLRVSVEGQQPHDLPLVAAEAVPKANFLQRLGNGFAGLVP